MVVGALDIGRAVNSYLSSSRAVYEAVRLAGRTPGVAAGTILYSCPSSADIETLEAKLCRIADGFNISDASFTIIRQANQTSQQVIVNDAVNGAAASDATTTMECTALSTQATISVLLQNPFQQYLPLPLTTWINRIAIEMTGPYLYHASDTAILQSCQKVE